MREKLARVGTALRRHCKDRRGGRAGDSQAVPALRDRIEFEQAKELLQEKGEIAVVPVGSRRRR